MPLGGPRAAFRPRAPRPRLPPETPEDHRPAQGRAAARATRPSSRGAPSGEAGRAGAASRSEAAAARRGASARPRCRQGAPTGATRPSASSALLVIGAGGWGAMRFLRSRPHGDAHADTRGRRPGDARSASDHPGRGAALRSRRSTPEPVATPTALAATPPPVAATPTPAPRATPSRALSLAFAAARGAHPAPTAAAPAAPSGGRRCGRSRWRASWARRRRPWRRASTTRPSATSTRCCGSIPGTRKATADRAGAVALRDASRKKFVAGRTVVKTEKATGSLAGFDTGDVALQKAPDFLGRIDFEMSPAVRHQAGRRLLPEDLPGERGQEGHPHPGRQREHRGQRHRRERPPAAAACARCQPQQRAELGEVAGTWTDGTTSWSAEVLVTANKGDSLKNTITWR